MAATFSLMQFIEKFKEVKEMTRQVAQQQQQQQSPAQSNGSVPVPPPVSDSNHISNQDIRSNSPVTKPAPSLSVSCRNGDKESSSPILESLRSLTKCVVLIKSLLYT